MGFFTIEKCYITEKTINTPKEGQYAGRTFRNIAIGDGKTSIKLSIPENYPDVEKLFDSLVVSDLLAFPPKISVYKVDVDYVNNKFSFAGITEVKLK